MTNTIILRSPSGHVIYKSSQTDARTAIAAAIEDGVSLHHADLSHLDLSGGDFDGGDFHGARFHATNLTGANLSECDLRGARFANACLHGACLAESTIENADFTGVLWGGTDIAGTTIHNCRFDTRSALFLDFTSCADFGDNQFITPDGHVCPMNQRPVILAGGPCMVAFLDDHIVIGTTAMPYAAWMENFSPDTVHGAYLEQLQSRLRAASRPHTARLYNSLDSNPYENI